MKSEFNEAAYELIWEVSHFEELKLDYNTDLEIVEYDGYDKYAFYGLESFAHPSLILFYGFPDVVNSLDYPYTDNHWSVMSPRMLDVLLSVGEFPHRAIPAAAIDWRIPIEQWYDASGSLKKDIAFKQFFVVQLTEHVDVFDYENSEYTRDEDNPERLDIETYVFKIPRAGLPPIFRIKERRTSLFISAEARAALKRAKITGTKYEPLIGYHLSDEPTVDVPIILPDEVYQ